jgi:DNA repair exonuclease SbcCD ATPase subunit
MIGQHPVVIDARPNSAPFEAELDRVRTEISEREAHWREERESLRAEVRLKNLQIEELAEEKSENPVHKAVFQACVGLGVHFENDFEAPTELTRELAILFRQITDGESGEGTLKNIDRLVSTDTERLLELLTVSFIRTNDRLVRYQRQMDEVRERTERVFERISAVADARKLRAKGGTSGRRGTKIPLFANPVKARQPLLGRNQVWVDGISPRTSTTTIRGPPPIHFI